MANSGAPASSASSDFCASAPAVLTRIESVSTSVDRSFVQRMSQEAVDGVRAIEPPAEIASDWAALADGLGKLSQTSADSAPTDPAQPSAAEQLEDQVTASSSKVQAYLEDSCGQGPSTAETTVPASTTSVGGVPVGSSEVFVGDFETGDFSQWSQCQTRVYSGKCKDMPRDFYGMQIVDTGTRQGQHAARFELREGDNPQWGGGERTELSRYKAGTVREGEERWYEFSLMFDPAFPVVTDDYFMVLQWHGRDDAPPPLAIEVQGDGQLVLTSHFPEGPPMVIGDIARGQWVDYVVHARFSQSSDTGWAEVYRDGVLTVPRHPRASMNSDYDYPKIGLYRDGHGSKPTAVMWADGFRITAPAP